MSLLDKASLIVTPNTYKTSKLYSVIPNTTLGDMNVVRATTATRVNSSELIESVGVNIPRLDYTNSTCPALLVEPQSTNLFTYSDKFDDANWLKYNSSIISATIISPNGTLNAKKIIDNSSNTPHIIYKNTITGTNQTVTSSVFAKAGEYNFIALSDNTTGQAVFNLTNGENTYSDIGITANKSVYYGNGWWRLSITFTVTTARGSTININKDGTVSGTTFIGTGTSGIYIWGAQLETGSYATSYIPTIASTVTRNADVISKTGISSLIGQTEGTVFFNGKINSNTSVPRNIVISDGTAANRVSLSFGNNGANRIDATLILGSVSQVIDLFSIRDMTVEFKLAFTYSTNNFRLFIDGIKIAEDLLGVTYTGTTLNQLNFSSFNNTQILDGSVKSLQLYKTALTDAECIDLTTL